jgi:hypothetical protein
VSELVEVGPGREPVLLKARLEVAETAVSRAINRNQQHTGQEYHRHDGNCQSRHLSLPPLIAQKLPLLIANLSFYYVRRAHG